MITTRCPACDTVFRVEPAHLKARQGKVRCGKCSAVFNALETLLEGPTLAPDRISVAPTIKTTATPAPEPEAEVVAEGGLADARAASETSAASVPFQSAMGSWWWGVTAMFALMMLLLQAAVVFRAEIALRAPGFRPQLQVLCAQLDCDIPLPRKAELLSVETSDMLPDPQPGGNLLFTATLRNRANFDQAYPHLELTLTDTEDKLRLRRVVAPDEYLPAPEDASTGFAATSDLVVSLHLQVAGAEVAGYRAYIFYP